MAKQESLSIKRLEGIHYYVHDLERSRKFYCGKLDFAETWRSSPDLEKSGRQKSAWGDAVWIRPRNGAPRFPRQAAGAAVSRASDPGCGADVRTDGFRAS